MKKISFLVFIIFSVTSLSSCSLWNKWFGSISEEEPAELVKFEEEVSLRREWKVNVGKGQGKKYNRLKPVIDGDMIYAAGNNGRVVAIERETGKRLWEAKFEFDITGGVGIGNGLILIGTENARVIALNENDGSILWEANVSSEVLSVPVTDGNIVVAQTVDGKLAGLNAETGEQIWIYESTVPALSLRGVSSPVISGNFVVAAFANGTVASVALDNGTLRWDERVAIPTGRSEIDRLVDIDGELYINENGLLLVPSYQGYFVAIDVTTGQTRWRVEASSTVGASSGFGNIYFTNERGHVKAYRVSQDDTVWENDQLDLRQVSAPAAFSNYVAVSDFEGYVHLLSQVDGRFVGRVKVDSKGIRAQVLSVGNTLYIFGNSGDLVAMSVQ